MKTQPGGQVIIQVGMVHHVQTPQNGDCMKHHVLKIYDKIKYSNPDYQVQPVWQINIVQQTPAVLPCRSSDSFWKWSTGGAVNYVPKWLSKRKYRQKIPAG